MNCSFFSTSVPLSAPKNLRVSEEWYNRFRISWDLPPSPTMGYRVVYQPLSGNSHTNELILHVFTWNLQIIAMIPIMTYMLGYLSTCKNITDYKCIFKTYEHIMAP